MNTWDKCKSGVDALSAAYDQIIAETSKKRPQAVQRFSSQKGEAIDIDMPRINGYEVTLLVRINKDKDVTQVKYYAWDGKNNRCYQRDLLSI